MVIRAIVISLCLAAWAGVLTQAAAAQVDCPGTARVSVRSNGNQGNSTSHRASISADGRFVAFESQATNLVSGDTNQGTDIFRHDTLTGKTIRVSVSSSGTQANALCFEPAISGDGRFVVFHSGAYNLVAGDSNGGVTDVFLHDTATSTTTLISRNSNGVQGNSASVLASISFDGRFIAFSSSATNLVPGDTNGATDAFLRDTLTGTTTRVSVDTAGSEANGSSGWASVSRDARYVAFWSQASNLVPGDTNARSDIFWHDTLSGTTRRVSVSSLGLQANGHSMELAISSDGFSVGFYSYAPDLVPGDTNGAADVFVHNTLTSTTTRVSVDSSGGQGNLGSYAPSVSADGRFVAFHSGASNLVTGDLNGALDIFVHDVLTDTTKRVSLSGSGAQANRDSGGPSITSDGRQIAFTSYATNLVPGDTNSDGDAFVRCTAPPPPCSTKYCTVGDGSTNNITNLDATGCDLSSPIRLVLSNGPPSQFTYLLIGSGTQTITNPAGAAGDLCITGGFISRYIKDLGPISAAGTFSVDISNSSSGGPGFGIPSSGGASIQPGETWNFQYWHRNPAGQPSGFSEAVAIAFY